LAGLIIVKEWVMEVYYISNLAVIFVGALTLFFKVTGKKSIRTPIAPGWRKLRKRV